MTASAPHRLGWLEAAGDPYAIGLALGRRGRRAVHEKLLASDAWRAVTDARHRPAVMRMLEGTRRLPWVLEELEGLAAGLDLPLEAVFAWHCRGDLLATASDGCTTVILPGESPCIAHNEDGLPCLDGEAFLARLRPDDRPGFLSFCYPGSLPGHTFALTEAGIVQAVNNLRLTGVAPELPRMVLSRAMLAQPDLAAILTLLEVAPPGGGFHFTLARQGEPEVLSLEVGGGRDSRRPVAAPGVHANHALHLAGPQVVTRSSADRQRRGEALLAGGECDPLAILADTGGEGLPIHRREPDDPDDENTLATAVFRLDEDDVLWEVWAPGDVHPYRGTRRGLFA
ncbi:C45 family autoproteolytic acyltransferase/hydolase [Halomonas ramblicola]|uniref:C45 family autoproteolytic acyltransferase/hydolase n=1 Tax=Halomonas ramblicola TaxID=747349 RepID=UPI0025B5D3BC|nr:C45 family peptidase [Halomonas ramblicola]MDN3521890.1 C45 family autoproteolytic acyltransferase/hydrolase [Halomonas ramblicola]